MSVTVRNPTRDELPTVWEVMCGAFGEEPRERFRRQLWEDSTVTLDQIRIVEVDGKIVSHVWVAERPVFYRGQAVLPMGGIGGVATLPEYRRHGFATLLLRDAIAYMERKGHAISMLFTNINPFYARLGWADFPEWRFRFTVRRVPSERDIPEGYSVRPCDFENDLPALQRLYRSHIRGLSISLCHARPDPFWKDGHPHYLGLRPSHVVVRNQQEIVAYACAFPTDNGLWLREFAYDPQHPQGLVALAIALAREATAEEKEGVVRGSTPSFHPLPQVMAALTNATLEHETGEYMMLRVIKLRQCLETAQPFMEATLNNAGLTNLSGSFSLSLTQPEQCATVAVRSGRVTISDSDAAEVTLPLTPREFFLLFFGALSAWQWRLLLSAKGVVLSEPQVALLDALFPPHPTVYWSGDHF